MRVKHEAIIDIGGGTATEIIDALNAQKSFLPENALVEEVSFLAVSDVTDGTGRFMSRFGTKLIFTWTTEE